MITKPDKSPPIISNQEKGSKLTKIIIPDFTRTPMRVGSMLKIKGLIMTKQTQKVSSLSLNKWAMDL